MPCCARDRTAVTRFVAPGSGFLQEAQQRAEPGAGSGVEREAARVRAVTLARQLRTEGGCPQLRVDDAQRHQHGERRARSDLRRHQHAVVPACGEEGRARLAQVAGEVHPVAAAAQFAHERVHAVRVAHEGKQVPRRLVWFGHGVGIGRDLHPE